MYSPRDIFWMNDKKSGAENLCERDDPRQTCIAMNAGDFKSNSEAERLGIMQYLYGQGPQPQVRGISHEAPDAKAVADAAAKESEAMREAQREHQPVRLLGIEARSYVENAVVSGAPVTETERAVAGKMGAEFTGPSPREITQAGGNYQEAADKAAEAQGLTEPPKPEEPKPPEGQTTPRRPA